MTKIFIYAAYYIPPKNSTRHALNDKNNVDVLYDDILNYNDSAYCIIYGDLNSRCGDSHDYIDNIVHCEDINNKISNAAVNEDNISARLSDDIIVNNVYDRILIEICITHDLLIVNGRTTSDPKGHVHCYTHNVSLEPHTVSSLVDYVLCIKSMIDRIYLKGEDVNPLSDYCTVTTNIALKSPLYIIHAHVIHISRIDGNRTLGKNTKPT